ncbi:MAG: tRNA uridine-5-carboxymethylaminomethyl(34) synthesis GTPase MnmE [Mycoplasmataceae bacterium]|jgi:tRNA modification GTPase|nr:tRNA uridine-5-carboxymethylaminomethyl(34) synthesis GTPase MnmE [Mycoplasmataceae bacterium]
MKKTIVALATPPINCAIHIIRVSGEKTYPIIKQITKTNIAKTGYAIQRCKIYDQTTIIDDVLLMKFVAPRSFTGEDLIEINCHGGIYLANKIIQLLIRHGATLAERGEFSQRAFLNHKISLNQASAINNLIQANNDQALKIANYDLFGNGIESLKKMETMIFDLLGACESNIDYPEYQDTKITHQQIIHKLTALLKQIQSDLKISNQCLKYTEGINVAIIGRPNVGKSSLLNCLCKKDVAIVSNIPGTTRDKITAAVNIDGLNINFIDTAGINFKTHDQIEKIGVERAQAALADADLILLLIDQSKKTTKLDQQLIEMVKNKTHIIVLNKTDLPAKTNVRGVNISVKKKQIAPLLKAIKGQFKNIDLSKYNGVIFQSKTLIEMFNNIQQQISGIIAQLKAGTSFDLIVNDLHEIHELFLTLTGKTDDYDFISAMFKKFCLGK